MGKTKMMRNKITKFLERRKQASFHEIMRHLNDKMRHGTTSNQLGNVLSKNPEYERCGTTHVSSILSGGYEISVWKLAGKED